MTRRAIQSIIVATVTICSATVVVSGVGDDPGSRSRMRMDIGTSQNVTIDFEDPGGFNDLVRAEEPPRGSRGVAAQLRDLLSWFRPSPIRASRRPMILEWPATVRFSSAPTMAGRSGRVSANGERSVSATIGCHFSIWDNDGGYWDWTYEARIFNPGNTQIGYAQHWASSKPSYSSYLTVNLNDPDEGTYTCKIRWWVQSYDLGESQATQGVSYLIPTGEETLENAWLGLIPTAYKWRGRLSGGNFTGRKVMEAEGGSDVDTCWWPASDYGPTVGLTGGDWDVDSSNEYGDDVVGWHFDMVSYYRSRLRAPCQSETNQIMKINRPGASSPAYKTNRLKTGFTSNTVWSYRDGQQVSKNY